MDTAEKAKIRRTQIRVAQRRYQTGLKSELAAIRSELAQLRRDLARLLRRVDHPGLEIVERS
jgi:hypothetical protein